MTDALPKIFVGIPVLNRVDLLRRCLAALDYPSMHIVVINNSRDPVVRQELSDIGVKLGIDVRHQPYNLGVSASWNKIIAYGMGLGFDHVYIGSNDTILNPGTLHKVEEYPKDPKDVLWHIHGWNFWCISVNAVTRVGWFDENFYPAYCEDVDYAYRCDCLAVDAGRVYLGTDGNDAWSHKDKVRVCPIPGVGGDHLGSQTIHSNKDYARFCHQTMHGSNVPHFNMKWGGGAHAEKFVHPYNDPKRDHRWWPDPEWCLKARDWDLLIEDEQKKKAEAKV